MSERRRLPELQRLNVLFCLLVVFIHTASHAVSALDKLSWQYAVVLVCQRLAFVSVPGFFLLSGVKLTLPETRPAHFPRWWAKRAKTLLLPYGIAAAVYYAYFVRYGTAFSVGDFLRKLALGRLAAPFYFLVTLVQFILLAPLFRRLAERYDPAALLPFALGIMWLSGIYANNVVQLFAPEAVFRCGDRIFPTYLFYYLAGCCIGARYDAFPAFLARNRRLLWALLCCFAAADAILSVLLFSGRRSVPFLEYIHTMYIISAIAVCFDAALRLRRPLPRAALAVDRASYLVYLYHCLILTLAQDRLNRIPGLRVGSVFALRLAAGYGVTIAACVAWQAVYRRAKRMLRPRART